MSTFTDNFTRANGTIGNGWSTAYGTVNAVILSNALNFNSGNYGLINSSFTTAIVDATLSITSIPDNALAAILYRYQNASNFYYAFAYHSPNGDAFVQLRKVVAGSDSEVTSGGVGGAMAAPAALRVVATGTSHKVYIGATLAIDTTDGDITGSGAFGIGYNGGDGGFASAFTITGTAAATVASLNSTSSLLTNASTFTCSVKSGGAACSATTAGMTIQSAGCVNHTVLTAVITGGTSADETLTASFSPALAAAVPVVISGIKISNSVGDSDTTSTLSPTNTLATLNITSQASLISTGSNSFEIDADVSGTVLAPYANLSGQGSLSLYTYTVVFASTNGEATVVNSGDELRLLVKFNGVLMAQTDPMLFSGITAVPVGSLSPGIGHGSITITINSDGSQTVTAIDGSTF